MPVDMRQNPKQRRVSRACDYCHRRGKRCRASNDDTRCQNCVAFDQTCTFDRPQKKRGAPPRRNHDNHHASVPQTDASRTNHSEIGEAGSPPNRPSTESRRRTQAESLRSAQLSNTPVERAASHSWQAPSRYRHSTIMDLVDLFFEIVYPIFPLFHQPSFIRRISRTEYTSDRSLFAVTMAVCALVSARVRDGAVFNPRWDLNSLQDPQPEAYYTEALQQLNSNTLRSDINTLRTHALLALAAIQDGKVRDMHGHLGRYHTIVATEGLHDESNWPQDIGIVEKEERRRLFWSMYTLDVFTSIVWGGVIRSREYQSSVSYPTEADDDMFDDSGFAGTAAPFGHLAGSPDTSLGGGLQSAGEISWIAGRNFVTDLYRVLEHILMRLCARNTRAQRKTLIDDVLQASDSLSQETVLNSVMQMHGSLPSCFKTTNPVTSKPRMDRFGFQAADIIATVQLLRMVLLSATGAGISERCQIANEVVNAFIAIPTAYHHAISVPLLFHLGVIGQILATTLEQPLSENDYSSIRGVMMAMVRLLSTLEGLHASKGASQRLKYQITRIDEYMTLQRHGAGLQPNRTGSVDTMSQRTTDLLQPTTPSPFGSHSIEETFNPSPFQLPSDILGDFSNIFDFSQLSWHLT